MTKSIAAAAFGLAFGSAMVLASFAWWKYSVAYNRWVSKWFTPRHPPSALSESIVRKSGAAILFILGAMVAISGVVALIVS